MKRQRVKMPPRAAWGAAESLPPHRPRLMRMEINRFFCKEREEADGHEAACGRRGIFHAAEGSPRAWTKEFTQGSVYSRHTTGASETPPPPPRNRDVDSGRFHRDKFP